MFERNFVKFPIQESVKEVDNFTQELLKDITGSQNQRKTTHAITVKEKDTG